MVNAPFLKSHSKHFVHAEHILCTETFKALSLHNTSGGHIFIFFVVIFIQ